MSPGRVGGRVWSPRCVKDLGKGDRGVKENLDRRRTEVSGAGPRTEVAERHPKDTDRGPVNG